MSGKPKYRRVLIDGEMQNACARCVLTGPQCEANERITCEDISKSYIFILNEPKEDNNATD